MAQDFAGNVPSDNKFALLIFGEEPEDRDARERTIAALSAILLQADFQKERILILKNDMKNDMKNDRKNDMNVLQNQANRDNILKAIEKYQRMPKKAANNKDRELFVYASLKTVDDGGTPYLICPSDPELTYLKFGGTGKFEYKADHKIHLQDEFIEPLGRSPIERRLLIFNKLSPKPRHHDRGNSPNQMIRERSPSKADIPVSNSGAFGQIVIDDTLIPGPGTVNSFVDILEKAMSGYADLSDTGNYNGKVDMNELLAYIERFGNMASKDAVMTLFKGQDFGMKSYQPGKDPQVLREERNTYIKNLPVPTRQTVATPQSGQTVGKWYCLLFAVNDFENPDVYPDPDDRLVGPYHDMQILKDKWLIPMREQMAKAQGKDKDENAIMEIVFLTDQKQDANGTLMRKDETECGFPTEKNFRYELDKIVEKAGKNDFILVAVACHGAAAHGRSVLCPYDMRSDKLFLDKKGQPIQFLTGEKLSQQLITEYIQENRMIAVKYVIDRLGQSGAGKKLLILDACRDIPNQVKDSKNDFMTEFKTLMDSFYDASSNPATQGLAVLTSCSLGQTAGEEMLIDKPNGFFFKSFAEGLEHAKADMAGNLNGVVSLNEAFSYAFAKTSERNKKQTPEMFHGGGWENFPLQYASWTTSKPGDAEFTDNYLANVALRWKEAKNYTKSDEIFTRLIAMEPNNSDAYRHRSIVRSAMPEETKKANPMPNPMPLYAAALDDSQSIGETLGLYVTIPASASTYQTARDRYNRPVSTPVPPPDSAPIYKNPSRDTPLIGKDNRPVTILENQKVSISAIDGDWLYVLRSSDDASQNGVGWIHKDYVTWSEKSAEQYRPATPMNPRPKPPMDAYGGGNPGRGGTPWNPATFPGINR